MPTLLEKGYIEKENNREEKRLQLINLNMYALDLPKV